MIMKAFRIGDWRLGIKELKVPGLTKTCPFGCQATFDLPHFLLWCPMLDCTRKETGIFDFFMSHRMKWDLDDKEIVKQFLYAMNDDLLVVKRHGNALIRMRNQWYRLANRHGIKLNVRTQEIH